MLALLTLGALITGAAFILNQVDKPASTSAEPTRTPDAGDQGPKNEEPPTTPVEPAPSEEVGNLLSTRIEPGTNRVNELTEFLGDRVGQHVVLDIVVGPVKQRDAMAASVSTDGDRTVVILPNGECETCGVELVVRELETGRGAVIEERGGEITIVGEFRVDGLGGVHQGIQSVGLSTVGPGHGEDVA